MTIESHWLLVYNGTRHDNTPHQKERDVKMKFVLKNLKASYFKGFYDVSVDFSPDTTEIVGDNETGKTTLYDAFCYCINKKNSAGESDFGIKPNFTSEIVSPSVEIECEIDGKPVSLRRTYQAKLTKDKKFSGYKTECYINGIPCGVKDFDNYIGSIVTEDVFKLLTFPNYFTELITPSKGETVSQAQCRMLKSLANVKNDKDIASSKKSYAPLLELLERYDTVDDIQRFYKSEVKRIHDVIDDIPVKIEQQYLNRIDNLPPEKKVLSSIQAIEVKKDALNNQRTAFYESKQEEKNKLTQDIQNTKLKTSNLSKEYSDKIHNLGDVIVKSEEAKALNETSMELRREVSELSAQRDICSSNMRYAKSNTASLEKSLEALKSELEDCMSKKDETCPLCGQPIPEEKVVAVQKENASKISRQISVVQEQIAEHNDSVKELENDIESLENEIADRKEAIKSIEDKFALKVKEVEDKEKALKLKRDRQISLLEESLKSQTESIKPKLKEIEESIVEYNQSCVDEMGKLNCERKSLEQTLFKISANRECQKKIDELEASRDKYNELLDNAQKYLSLSEKFITERSKLLENAVNKMFENTKFKFSKENKSGKVTESCVPTFNGQEYKDLSASTKAICNIDIVKGFQKYYDAYLPVFIDNAEGITEKLDTNTQTVLLSVRKELCPECGGETGRKQENGLWKCKKCGNEFVKSFEVKHSK